MLSSCANNVNDRPRESGGSTGGSSKPTKSRFGAPGLPGYISMYDPETMVERPEMPPTPTCGRNDCKARVFGEVVICLAHHACMHDHARHVGCQLQGLDGPQVDIAMLNLGLADLQPVDIAE